MSEQVRLLLTILQMDADEWHNEYQNREAPEDFVNGFAALWNSLCDKIYEVYGVEEMGAPIEKYKYFVDGKPVKSISINNGSIRELRRI